ncbi:MAG: acyltransferase [Cytophagaceae bacterium]|nr:MAG: acyltransferase [Cytophagaceae bacterium]
MIIFICEHFYISIPIKNDYSYGIYLYAWPIQQMVVFYAERADFRLSPLTLFLSSGLLTLLAAILSWHLLEKPAMALKELRWTSRRSPTMPSIPIEMPAPISINASAKNI